MKLVVYSLAWPVKSLGPGLRAVLWLAGCDRGCVGCVSPEMSRPENGRPLDPDRLADRLARLDERLIGLTVSGGEPFDQAEALAGFLETLASKRPLWNFLVYSGYTLAEIKARPDGRRVLDLIDVLIDGPFRAEVPSQNPLAGSGNQTVHHLSPRGLELRNQMDDRLEAKFDVGLGRRGFSMLVGVGRSRERARVRRQLGLVPAASNPDR